MNLAKTVEFLRELEANNTKDWFTSQKPRYDALRTDFETTVQDIIERTSRFDPAVQGLQAHDCLFRIHRDLRFSKNRTPYHTSFSAALIPGEKASNPPTYYLHLDAQGRFIVAGGVWTDQTQDLNKIRQAIVSQPEQIKQIMHAPEFEQNFGELDDDRLKGAPRGYPADHPEIRLLQLKRFTASHDIGADSLSAQDIPAYVATQYQTLFPLITYLRQAMA